MTAKDKIGPRGKSGKLDKNGPKAPKNRSAKKALLDALVEHFDDVYQQLTRQMKLIVKMQQQLDVVTARLAQVPADGTRKPCPIRGCGGTLIFGIKTPVPGTGGGFVNTATGRRATEPETSPGWSCSTCHHIEWITK
jgi:hypothetical protein